MTGRIVVVGNEKGGVGKSTVAVHLAVALAHSGASVAVMDLDVRQGSLAGFIGRREAWSRANGVELVSPVLLALAEATPEAVQATLTEAAAAYEVVIVDTPGAQTEAARAAHQFADLMITPMNDSFMDLDVLGRIDPVTLELGRPSFYAEAVWQARMIQASRAGRAAPWFVVRNRLASLESRNRKKVDERLVKLARKVGFQVATGLKDRVIYRELFPFGLTVTDLGGEVKPIPLTLAHVAAKQDIRALIAAVGLNEHSDETLLAAQ